MDILHSDYKAGVLHHAYLFQRSTEINDSVIKFVENTLSMPTRGNPDVIILDNESFTINSARELKELESRVATSGERKVFVISFNFITREAENALLKVLEEPSAGTHFFLMTTFGDRLLPTLLSRLHVVDAATDERVLQSSSDISIKEFLTTTEPERIKLMSKLVEDKDKTRAILFLNSLESELYLLFKKGEMKEVSVFKNIRDARSYMADRAPSVKMLLENIAISVPKYA